jgi:hypothetical protein
LTAVVAACSEKLSNERSYLRFLANRKHPRLNLHGETNSVLCNRPGLILPRENLLDAAVADAAGRVKASVDRVQGADS